MTDRAVPSFVRDDLARLGVQLSENQWARLSKYVDLLLEVNRQFNLTAVRDRDTAWRRHIIDSLTLVPQLTGLQASAKIIDVGSGGGLPGIPLAIALPSVQVTLLEGTQKKAKFLSRCVVELPLPGTTVVAERAETVGRDSKHRQRYDVAVCRAVGPMRGLLEYTLPLVKVGGRVLAMKGPKVEGELDTAGDALALLGAGEMNIESAYPPDFGLDGVLVSITKERKTPAGYPRPPGQARHLPL